MCKFTKTKKVTTYNIVDKLIFSLPSCVSPPLLKLKLPKTSYMLTLSARNPPQSTSVRSKVKVDKIKY